MLSIFKAKAPLAHKLQKKLVDHAGGLQKIPWTFPLKNCSSNPTKLRIHHREERFGSSHISVTPIAEQHRNFTR